MNYHLSTTSLRVFLIASLLGFAMALYGQETDQIKVSNIDTTYLSYLEKLKKEAILKRVELEKHWQESKPDTVYTVRISGLYYESFPDISRFSNLKVILANKNLIRNIPGSVFCSDSLQRVNFEQNEIKRIKFKSKPNLVSVKLSENQLKRIPRSLRKVKNLETLELANNRIKRVPGFLLRMDNLQEVNLNFNRIKLSKRAVKRLARINTILLAGNNISALPENIHELKAAKKLNFSKNQLQDLPKSFKLLDSLTSIIFYQNEFTEIPEELFHLKNLSELDFYYNEISSIPDAIGSLGKLKQLFLSFNQISQLPDTIASLTSLRYLYLHHNDLVVIPSWITRMNKLERLDVSYNKLIELPDLSKIATLTEIDIQENQIEYFPWELLDKKNLKSLMVRGNPFILNEEEELLLKHWNDQQLPGRLILVY